MVSTQTGKDIKTKADEARRDIPSQFLGAPKGNLSDTFETKVAALSDEQDQRNNASRKSYDEDHDEREASRAGVLDGRIRDDMHGDRERRLQRLAEEKRKERAETAMYLAMLQDRINGLGRQIDWHNNEIDRLTNEVNDLQALGDLIASGKFDPNNPAHAALRDKTPISQNDIDSGDAPAKIEAEIDDKQTQIADHTQKRDQARIQRDDLQERHNDMARAHDEGRTPDFTQPKYDKTINEFKADGHEFDRNNPTQEQVTHLRRYELSQTIEASSTVEHHERAILTLEELASYDGPDRIQRIDEFIAGSSAATIELIVQSPDSDPVIASRIGLFNFYDELSSLDELKGTPDYQMYVQMAVDDAPETVRDALRNEPNLSEELSAALYKPYSDELDAKMKTAASTEEITNEPPVSGLATTTSRHDPNMKPFSMG